MALLLAFALPGATASADYGRWDADGSGGISSDEFRIELDDMNTFDDLDTNNDGQLGTDELRNNLGARENAFRQRIGDDYSRQWDSDYDGLLSRKEFNNGLFESYDADADRMIEREEYSILQRDAANGGILRN